jgi:Cu2+-exporting ATPase
MSKNRESGNAESGGVHASDHLVVPITHHPSLIKSNCFHCNEPISAGVRIVARVSGNDEPVCCHGCRAVAELIAGSGLQDYYRFRDVPARRVDAEPAQDEWLAYDRPDAIEQLTCAESDGTRSAALVLDGIGCAACGWLIDRMLKREVGVCEVNVNAATARMRVQWRPDEIAFSRILQRLASLGYRPHAVSSREVADRSRDERRAALKRLAVAGFGMMQVMMIAVAFYADSADSMGAEIRAYLRYVSLLCATPVLFYAGWPFLVNAWRAVRARAVVMDVPVSVGLALAYGASILNTLRGVGEVYFDSVTMFVFFLSLGRFVEMTARHRTGDVTDALARLMPTTAHRTADSVTEDVPVSALKVDDRVIVRVGETVPADGVVIEGASKLDESMLSGESLPVSRGVADRLTAGTMNLHAPLTMRVTALGQSTVLSGIVRLLQRAEHEKAPQATAADRAASWFLARILVGAGLVAAIWLMVDPSRAFEITLSVLVVTCPCALSLATPTALAAATTALAKRGVLVTKASALEALAKINRVVFDKTGTLTHGRPSIGRCESLANLSEAECRRIALALEQHSEHPIASAFRVGDERAAQAYDVAVVAGEGIEGAVAGKRYRIGRRGFVGGASGHDDSRIYLGDATGVLAAFSLSDTLRSDARDVVLALQSRSLPCEILSGDAWTAAAHTARECGIEQFTARQSPANKLEYVRELAERGERVAMIGDGINDAPVLKGASVSIAMGRASALAQVSADIVLVGDSLSALPNAIDVARRTQRIIKQNLAWAATYNLLALPIAALGFVPPWLAAIGMSFSSIVVVTNAMRLNPRTNVIAREREVVKSTDDVSHSRAPDLAPSRVA